MIVVIQCASQKRADAGFLRTRNAAPVIFVADPRQAPPIENGLYARPDDLSDSGESWRDVLLEYNSEPGDNPLRLLPAFQLYANGTYRRIVEQLGARNTYILSAGWGLINAEFLTPCYDITFSVAAEPFKRRRKAETYRDLCMLPEDVEEPMLFFGGRDYLPLFCALTKSFKCKKTVFYNSGQRPDAPGASLVRFQTTTRTNWHYECANAFLNGEIGVA